MIVYNRTSSPINLWNVTYDPEYDLTLNQTALEQEIYDYQGALLFVLGLLSIYGITILFLFISLIRKSRSEMEVVDHLHDFEAWQRHHQKRSMRYKGSPMVQEASPPAGSVGSSAPIQFPIPDRNRRASVSFGLNFVNANSGIGAGQFLSAEMV